MTPYGDLSTITVGKRVECNGYYGTLLYVGPVPPTKGTWLGIDWDDPARGKHDGSHEGVKFFTTRHPTSGSFVRSEKVNFGQSCPSAIRTRYGEVKGDTAGVDRESLDLLKKEMNAKFLEVVGFDKVNRRQSQFDELQVVWLREQGVNGPGQEEELQQLCPNVRELDISKNLLNSWESVAQIVRQLKHLKVLNVSENRLEIPASTSELREVFQSLEHIIAERVCYSWTNVLECENMWPNVQRLQVPFNRIIKLQIPTCKQFTQLKFLDLEGNIIQDWSEVNKLGCLSSLEVLNLTNLGLGDIRFTDYASDQKTDSFPHLKQLQLSENNITSWNSFSELDKLKQLEDLRIRDNPVLSKETLETCRQVIIARIQNLKILNGADISPLERKGAQVDYLKKYGRAWLEAVNTKSDSSVNKALQQFYKQHPQYSVLIEKYGAPEEGELLPQSSSLKTMLITVELFSPDHKSKSFRKKLPKTMTIQKLKGLVQRLFNTDNEIPKLAYISSKNPETDIILDNDLKSLSFYSVEDGDSISVRW